MLKPALGDIIFSQTVSSNLLEQSCGSEFDTREVKPRIINTLEASPMTLIRHCFLRTAQPDK